MNRELVIEAGNNLDVIGLTLWSVAISVDDSFNPQVEPGATTVNLQWGPRSTSLGVLQPEGDAAPIRVWAVRFATVARIFKGESRETKEGQPDLPLLAELAADFLLQYQIKGDWDNPEALREFTVHNVPVHAWPYWREWLQSTVTRIGLPPLILSMHMLPRSKEQPMPPVQRSPEREPGTSD